MQRRIEDYSSYIRYLTKRYITLKGLPLFSTHDEIYVEGLHATWECINRYGTLDDDIFYKLLNIVFDGRLSTWKRNHYMRIKRDRFFNYTSFFPSTLHIDKIDRSYNVKQKSSNAIILDNMINVLELKFKRNITEIERTILKGVLEGLNDTEIANKANCSRQNVYRFFKKIRQYEDIVKELRK